MGLFIPLDTEEGREWPITVVLVNKATNAEVDRSTTTAGLLGGHMTTLGIMWNALSVSGGVSWRHPRTGETYPRGLAWHVELIHPETKELVTATLNR